MILNAVNFRCMAYLATAWLPMAAAYSQPNLADLLDQEDAAQTRPVAAMADPNAATTDRPSAGPRKEPIPNATETKQAITSINDIFRADLASATTPEQRVALAKQFLAQAARTTKMAERWGLLIQAVQLASDASDSTMAFSAIDALGDTFDVNLDAARIEALAKMVPKAPPATINDLARVCISMSRSSIAKQNLVDARKLAAMTGALAKKSRNRELLTDFNQLSAAIKEAESLGRERDSLLSKVETNPTDPSINSDVGDFFCFKQNDWPAGLPFLVKGENERLAQVAARELAAPKSDAAVLALADSWWVVSETENGVAKAAIQMHAVDIYRRVLKTLSGLERVRVEKRISAATAASIATNKSKASKTPGLVLWLDASQLPSFDPVMRRGGPATKINAWRDLSGRGHDAVQTDPTKQPLWTTDGFDGSPGVVFSETQTLNVSMACGQEGTILVALQPRAVGNMRFLGCYRNQGEHVGLCLRSDGSVWAEAMMPGNTAAVVRSNASWYSAEAKLLLGQSWGKSLLLIGAGSVPAAPFAETAAVFPGPWGIGGAFVKQPVEYFNGVLGEVLVFDRELTPAELESLSGDLAAKWRCR
ncbi:MAG: hypothetical protein ACKO1M_02135 [Planctomycetota bacterium]